LILLGPRGEKVGKTGFGVELGRPKASVLAKVEHPFRVIKRQFGFVKERCCGLKKKTAQLVTFFARSNLWIVRGKLMAAQG
jgi:IS5 family transposase